MWRGRGAGDWCGGCLRAIAAVRENKFTAEDYCQFSAMMDCVIAFYEKPCCPPFGKLCGVGHSKGSDPIYA